MASILLCDAVCRFLLKELIIRVGVLSLPSQQVTLLLKDHVVVVRIQLLILARETQLFLVVVKMNLARFFRKASL